MSQYRSRSSNSNLKIVIPNDLKDLLSQYRSRSSNSNLKLSITYQ